MPLMATTAKRRYQGVVRNYHEPNFGKKCLQDLIPMTLQAYFSGLASSPLSHESKDKIRDVLSSILKLAVHLRTVG